MGQGYVGELPSHNLRELLSRAVLRPAVPVVRHVDVVEDLGRAEGRLARLRGGSRSGRRPHGRTQTSQPIDRIGRRLPHRTPGLSPTRTSKAKKQNESKNSNSKARLGGGLAEVEVQRDGQADLLGDLRGGLHAAQVPTQAGGIADARRRHWGGVRRQERKVGEDEECRGGLVTRRRRCALSPTLSSLQLAPLYYFHESFSWVGRRSFAPSQPPRETTLNGCLFSPECRASRVRRPLRPGLFAARAHHSTPAPPRGVCIPARCGHGRDARAVG